MTGMPRVPELGPRDLFALISDHKLAAFLGTPQHRPSALVWLATNAPLAYSATANYPTQASAARATTG